MHRTPNLRFFLSLLLALAMILSPAVPRAGAAPQERGQGDIHRADPCTDLPNPPGSAEGIEKQCPAGGSSSGVVRGDFNGDGYADLAIAAPGATINGQAGAGEVIVMLGSPSGLTGPGRQVWFEGNIPGTTAEAGDAFGTALASGDFNGDGYSDLAIGIPNKKLVGQTPFGSTTYSDSGAVVVIYGSPNGLTTTDPNVPTPRIFNLSMPSLPGIALGCGWNLAHAHLGASLSWGDFNHDGRGDLAIGAPDLANTGLCFQTVVGGVWELLGSATGLGPAGNVFMTQTNIPMNQNSPAHLGAALAAGDFNGDGIDDLAIGAPNAIATSGRASGVAVVLSGSATGVKPAALYQTLELTALLNVNQDSDSFGASLAAGDFNGDGRADLAVGAPGAGQDWSLPAGAGLVLVFFGGASLTANAETRLDGSWFSTAATNDRFGTTLAAGDFNGDGKTDLAVGAPLKDFSGLTDAGEVDVLYGISDNIFPDFNFNRKQVLHNLNTPHSGEHFGAALSAWNFGRDELFGNPPLQFLLKTADLAVGIPFETVNGVSGAGAVNVFYGSVFSNGLTITNTAILTSSSIFVNLPAGAHLGAALY